MEKRFKSKITIGMLLLLMVLSIFFSTGVFAENKEADKTATEEIGVAYRGHVQDQGNMPKPEGNMVTGPEALGTRAQSLRVEGFWIELTGNVPEGANIVYEVHVQNEGWMKPEKNGIFAGTTGECQRVESIKIRLENLPGYDVYYRGHVENLGDVPKVDGEWGWKKNGEELGTTGSSQRLEELQVKIVKQPDTTTAYDKAGTFGPKTGVEVIENDVSINTSDVVLQNLHIKGNLTIGEGVGEGDVTLNNITVEGETYVRGGGKNSIHINGGEYNKITIQQTSSGQVRIVATNAAGLEVVVSEAAKGEDIILEGAFENVQIDAPDVKISTQGDTTIKEMVVGESSTGSEITLDKDTTVNKIDLNASVDMKGEGTIEKANVNSDDVTFEQKPVEEVVAPEVKVPPVVTPPEPPKPPTPTEPSGPSAEDLKVAEFNNTKNNVAMLELILKNALGLDLTGFDKLDYLGESIVSQSLLNKDGFANKAAVQAAVTEGIKLAQDNAPAKAYMETLFSYTPSLSVEDNTCTVTYPKELTTIQNSLLSGLYADLVIMIDTPLTDTEVLELTVNGTPKQVSNKDFAGKEILLSKLLGRKLGDGDLVQNQKSTFTISVKDVSTKVERNVTVCPCTSKNGEEYFKNFTNAYALMLTPFWLEAYADTLTIDYKNSEFLFNYAGNLTDMQKQGLAGYYADTIIRLYRPLAAGESIKISGMGTAATLTSSTVMDNAEKTEIRLSKLMGVVLGPNNLATVQVNQAVSLTDIKLIRSNGISVNAVLAKANGAPIDTGKGYGTPIYSSWMDEYMDTVSLSAENSKITVSYKGKLFPATVTGLGAYQADVIIYLDRELEADETITVSALGVTETLTKAKLVDNQIKLSDLMDITRAAAEKSGDDVIEFSGNNLNHNVNIYANPVLVNNDDQVYLNMVTNVLLWQPSFKAYSDSVELSSVDNKFLVNYKGGLTPADQAKLDGYYADAMIYLDRPLEANETVKIKAFTQDVVISNASPAEDDGKRCYRLSKLLNIKLGDANLAVKQTGSFEISVEEITLEKQLNVSARAILVKDSDIEYLDNYTGMSINPPSFEVYDNSVQINIDNYQGFTITHKGGLSSEDITDLNGLYGDTLISFERPLEFGESIKVSAYDKVAVITRSSFKKWGDNRIGLTELLGISAAEAPLATEQGNDIKINFSEINTKSPIGIAAWKGLVKGDGTWVYRANNGIGFSLYPLFIDAYKNNITLTTGENKISVTYLDTLTPKDKEALGGYYADAMINLNRPLVGNEKVTINAFGKPLTVDSTMVKDNNGTQIKLSDLLKITLSPDQLAANQTGGFDITVINNTLESDLMITAEAILVKGDDFEYLQKAASLELKSTVFETAVAAYTKALTVSQVDNIFYVAYAGDLSDADKAGLNGFYSNAWICLSRPLELSETVTVKAFDQVIEVNSSTFTDETDKQSIDLSKLLGLDLGEAQLAANQKGAFEIKVTGYSLNTQMNIAAYASLTKGFERRVLYDQQAGITIGGPIDENKYSMTGVVGGKQPGVPEAVTTVATEKNIYLEADATRFNAENYPKIAITEFTKTEGSVPLDTPVVIRVTGEDLAGLHLFGFAAQSSPTDNDKWWDIVNGGWGDGSMTIDQALAAINNDTIGDFYAVGSPGTYTFKLQMIDAIMGIKVLAETEELTVTIGADQAAPLGLTGLTPTTLENTDGMIIGTTELMEYKLKAADENTYVPCADITTMVAVPGTYLVRNAAQTGSTAGTTAEVTVSPWNATDVEVDYQGFVDEQPEGGWLINRGMLETHNQDFSFDAIRVNLANAPTEAKIKYQTFNGPYDETVIGWTDLVSDGETAGSDILDGTKHPIEAIKLSLENMPGYSVIYQVYVKNHGWQSWVRDGEMSGTQGRYLLIEAIRIRIIKVQ